MLYLILQTTALFFGIYFIGTFIGCLLHKFFNMLFGSNDNMAIAGAAGVSSRDLKLFTDGKNAKVARTIEEQSHVPGQKLGASLPSDAVQTQGIPTTSHTKTVHQETVEQLQTHDSKALKKRGFWGRWFGGPTEKIITKQTKVPTGLPVDDILDNGKKIAAKVNVPTVAAVTAAAAAIATAVQSQDDPKIETKTASSPTPTVSDNSAKETIAPVTAKTQTATKGMADLKTTDMKTATVNKLASTKADQTKTPKKKGFWNKWFGNRSEKTDGLAHSTETKVTDSEIQKTVKPKVTIPMADKALDSGQKISSKITVPAVGAVAAAAATIATTLKDDGQALVETIKDKIPEIPDVKDVLSDVKAAVTPENQMPALDDSKLDIAQPDATLTESTPAPDTQATVQEIKEDSPQEAKTEETPKGQPTEAVTSEVADTTTLAGSTQAMTDDIIPITEVQGTEVQDKIIKAVKDVADSVIKKDS